MSSYVGTPSKNGIAKRTNIHLLETSQELLFQMKFRKQFWANVFSATCFLINCMPSWLLTGDAPYNVLFSTKSLFSVAPRIFGNTCYIWDVRLILSKLNLKALKCGVWGYSLHEKSYYCYFPDLNRYLLFIDVTFLEATPFWYQTIIPINVKEDECLVYKILVHPLSNKIMFEYYRKLCDLDANNPTHSSSVFQAIKDDWYTRCNYCIVWSSLR